MPAKINNRPLRFLKGDALATVKRTRWGFEVCIGYIRHTPNSGIEYHYVIKRFERETRHEAILDAREALARLPAEEPKFTS